MQREGWGGRQLPPMMIEKVMIQLGANNLKYSGGVGGGSASHDDRESDDSIRGAF